MELKIYNEKFLDRQVEIVNKVTKDWLNYNYPDADQLKEVYGREGFTPETRFYAFDVNKMVGFVASAVENKDNEIQWGSIQYPFVDLDDKSSRIAVEKELIDKAKEILKSMGVNKIRSIFSDKWPVDTVKAHYTAKEVVQNQAIVDDISSINTEGISEKVRAMDMENDLEAFHKGVIIQFPDMTFDQMKNILKQAHDSDNFIKRLVVVENDMVVAQGRIGRFENTASIIYFAYHDDGVKYKGDIIKALVKEVHNLEGIDRLQIDRTTSNAGYGKGLEEFNFDFYNFRRYEINL